MSENKPPNDSLSIPVREQPSSGLDLSLYHQWRDYLYKLQVGELELPFEPEKSSELGHMGRCIGQRLVLQLAEEAPSILSQHNGIATVDEVPDQKVIIEASLEDRDKYFQEAFLSESRRRSLEDLPDRADSYAVAGVTMGTTILDKSLEDTKALLLKSISDSTLHDGLKVSLTRAVKAVSPDKVKTLTDFLVFSQTQLVQEDEYALKRKFKPEVPLGSEPIEIGGQTYEFSGSGESPIQLTVDDERVLSPLFAAVRRGRKEMVEQARETAYQDLGVERGSLDQRQPPSWWCEAELLERLRSDEVLIFRPYERPKIDSLPPLFQELYDRPEWKAGWNVLRIDRNQKSIIGVNKLVS